MLPSIALESRRILGMRVDATNYGSATQQILEWARLECSCYVCCASVNNIMEAHDAPQFAHVMEDASLVTSDGMPLVWLLRRLGVAGASRVYGPDLTPMVLAAAANEGIPVGFYGASETVLNQLVAEARRRYPSLQVAYVESPPFRKPTAVEAERTIRGVHSAGVRILFVGLGSPKQDFWMHAHVGRINAVMLGVGAAFDFLAGTKPQAPRWMQRSGLEWLFRLATEPKRLWRRYLQHNPRFVVLALMQLLRTRLDEYRRTT
jgi:N-acetylglucosaminyldiphosphoundecaprenol N-acetyl-beta-D-mannosaminyltransferase